MDKQTATKEYEWGWSHHTYAEQKVVEEDPMDVPPPTTKTTTNDADAMKEMQESAYIAVRHTDVKQPRVHKAPPTYPKIEDMSNVPDDVKKVLIDIYTRTYNDPDKIRRHKFENHRKDILKKLQSHELLDPVIEANRRNEMLRYGMNIMEDADLAVEETIEETVGMEVVESERFVRKVLPRGKPPGPEPAGRGAFYICTDGSGTMKQTCQGSTVKKFDIASGLVWTFIQEAKTINRQGRSHYIGIYGFDHCMYYPVRHSEYPNQMPLNPLPCDDILLVEKDFLRYWPDMVGDGTSWMGGTDWDYTLPAVYADYTKFRGGDLIIICDGDARQERQFFAESDDVSDAGHYFKELGIDSIPEDKDNPTILMKLQKFMSDNNCGVGYLFWLIPDFKTDYQCPSCHTNKIHFLAIRGGEFKYRCENNHEWWEDSNKDCAARDTCHSSRSGCGFGCADCRYFHLVLGEMLGHGTRIFKGRSVDDLLSAAANTIADQRKRRLNRGEIRGMYAQDDEE
jgi:hypothetical protein